MAVRGLGCSDLTRLGWCLGGEARGDVNQGMGSLEPSSLWHNPIVPCQRSEVLRDEGHSGDESLEETGREVYDEDY